MVTFTEDAICLSDALDKVEKEEGTRQRKRAFASHIQGQEFNAPQTTTTQQKHGERIHEMMQPKFIQEQGSTLSLKFSDWNMKIII